MMLIGRELDQPGADADGVVGGAGRRRAESGLLRSATEARHASGQRGKPAELQEFTSVERQFRSPRQARQAESEQPRQRPAGGKQPASNRRERDHENGRDFPEHEQCECGKPSPKSARRFDRAGPHRIVERGEQQTHHRGVDAARAAWSARANRADSQNGSTPIASRRPAGKSQGGKQRPASRSAPAHHRAEIGGKREQRSRDGLCGAIAGEKRIVDDPTRRNDLRCSSGSTTWPPPNTSEPER